MISRMGAAGVLLVLAFSLFPAHAAVFQDGDDESARHERFLIRKERRDEKFRELSEGVLDLRKITYASRAGGMEIPAYLFQSLEPRGDAGHPALVWVHGGVHGDLDPEHYFPFIKEAVERGYVVIGPEYRGSTGYGREHYDAIDYGGFEVEDCLSAVDYLRENLPHVDQDRIGIIGWSHGGLIILHAVFRDAHPFQCAAALVPVTNLIFRLSYKGPRYQKRFAAQERIGGLPHEKRDIYIERSPLYHVEKLSVPLLVHVADNDTDVNFVEAEMLVNALRVKKPEMAETKIYHDPPGGHAFNRQVDTENGYVRKFSREQRDSWNRIWTFLEWNLEPWRTGSEKPQ